MPDALRHLPAGSAEANAQGEAMPVLTHGPDALPGVRCSFARARPPARSAGDTVASGIDGTVAGGR